MANKSFDKDLLDACKDGQLDKVKASLAKGADITCIDEDGFSPLMLALAWCHPAVYNYLLDKYEDDKNVTNQVSRLYNAIPLHYAAGNCDSETVQRVAKLTDNINFKSRANKTPLDLAILCNNVGAVITLLRDHSNHNEKKSMLKIYFSQKMT